MLTSTSALLGGEPRALVETDIPVVVERFGASALHTDEFERNAGFEESDWGEPGELIETALKAGKMARAPPGGTRRRRPITRKHEEADYPLECHPYNPKEGAETMIQFTRDGVKTTATAEEIRVARQVFERDKLLRLPGLIAPEFGEVIQAGMERDGFHKPDEATINSTYGGWYGRVRQDLNPGPTNDMLNARANDREFLKFVEQVCGTPPLGRCVGRVFRLLPTDQDLPWHTDAEGGRLADLVVDLSAARYQGGDFEMRHADSKKIFTTVSDMQYREGTLARISEAIEHHNLRVTSTTPRITFVGWFVPEGQM
jgi:hypothetical protein